MAAVPGLHTNLLTLMVDGEEVTPEVSSVVIRSRAGDADFKSFANGPGGLREYYAVIEAVQGGKVWRQVWDHLGETIPVIARPGGNATATVADPHYTGNVKVTEPDGDLIGGEYDESSTNRWTIEVEWVFDEKPDEITGA